MRFEWDPKKAAVNLRKHSVSFEDATTVLEDDLSLTGEDPDHSEDEERMVTFGLSSRGRLLAVSHTDRQGTIRIITTRSESILYEQG